MIRSTTAGANGRSVSANAEATARARDSFHTFCTRATGSAHWSAAGAGSPWVRATTAAATTATTDAPTNSSDRRRADVSGVSCCARSFIDGQRSPGAGDNPRSTTRCSHPGAAPSGGDVGRSNARLFSASSWPLSPANGRLPYSASHIATQNAYWSPAGSTRWPACCSGAMYGGVPMTEPASVSGLDSAAVDAAADELSIESVSEGSAPPRASPKSSTRARPSTPTSTLPGLKSRCTIPAAWAAASPRAASTKTATTSGHDRVAACNQ